MRWVKGNGFDSCTEVVQSLTNGVPWRSVLEPVLLRVFANDLEDGIEYSLSMLAGYMTLRAVNKLEGRISVQKDVNRLEKLADGNLMNFRKDKYTVLPVGRNNYTEQDTVGAAA